MSSTQPSGPVLRQEGPSPSLQPALKSFPQRDLTPQLAPTPGRSSLPTPAAVRSRGVGFGLAARLTLAAAAVGGALYGGSLLAPKPTLTEDAHPNWKYVQQATQQANDKKKLLILGAGGGIPAVNAKLNEKQTDPETTTKVVAAINRLKAAAAPSQLAPASQGNSQAQQVEAPEVQKQVAEKELKQILVEAQQIPAVVNTQTNEPLQRAVVTPEISEGLKQALLDGDATFFHLYMFDCCAEDGDVIEVQLNGRPFAIVPITHKGATLSVPITKGEVTSVAFRGVTDGGGGITVAFKSSEGDAFVGVINEDEVVPFGLVTGK